MKLISMKLKPRDKSTEEKMYPTMASDQPEYPYGLSINLDEEQLKALGITTLPAVSSIMTLTAAVTVCSISERENQDGRDRSLSLQITQLALTPGVPSAEESDD